MYQLTPLAVTAAFDRKAVLEELAQARQTQQPVLARRAGTNLTGQSMDKAVVLDNSRYLNRVLELKLEESWVRVPPGVVCA